MSVSSVMPSVAIFPNPATDNIAIDIRGIAGKKKMMIYDMLGKEILVKVPEMQDENMQQLIDVSALAKATYVLRLDVNGELFQVIRFVKN